MQTSRSVQRKRAEEQLMAVQIQQCRRLQGQDAWTHTNVKSTGGEVNDQSIGTLPRRTVTRRGAEPRPVGHFCCRPRCGTAKTARQGRLVSVDNETCEALQKHSTRWPWQTWSRCASERKCRKQEGLGKASLRPGPPSPKPGCPLPSPYAVDNNRPRIRGLGVVSERHNFPAHV